jgi:hypothetical protein
MHKLPRRENPNVRKRNFIASLAASAVPPSAIGGQKMINWF